MTAPLLYEIRGTKQCSERSEQKNFGFLPPMTLWSRPTLVANEDKKNSNEFCLGAARRQFGAPSWLRHCACMSIIYRLLVVFLRILLQAQIGADPQNIRLAYCIQYKADDSLIWYIVVGAVGAAASLLALVVVAMSCVRHRRNDDTSTTEAQDDFGTQDVVHRNTPVISDVRPTSLFPLSMFPGDESARSDTPHSTSDLRLPSDVSVPL